MTVDPLDGVDICPSHDGSFTSDEIRNKLSLGSRMSNPKDRNTMNRNRLYLTAIFTGVLYIILVVNTPVVSGKEITKRTLNGQVGIINGKYSDIA